MAKPAVALRAYAPADYEGVLRLYSAVFGASAAKAFASRWHWSQVENLCPERTPKWVLDADGNIVGFLATVPIPYRIAGQRIMTHAPSDFMVDPKFQFHGLKLARECFKTCQAAVSLDDIASTIAVSKFLKARSTGTMRRHVKVLDARLALRRWPRLRVLPSLAWWPGRLALALQDLPAAARHRGVRRFDGSFDGRFDRIYERCLAAAPLVAGVERGARYLSWRYGPSSPQAHRVVGVVTDRAGELDGYVVCCLSRDAENTGFILELVVRPGAACEDALLAFAVAQLRRQGAWLLRWHLLDEDSAREATRLRRWRFRRREAKHELLVKLEEPGLTPPTWQQQFGDAEASHGAVL